MPDGKKPWEKYSNNNSTPKPWEKYSNEVKKKESSQPTSQEDVWGPNSQPKDAYTSLVTDQQIPQQESVISDGEQPKMRTLGVDITAEEALKPTNKKSADKFETAKPYIKKTQLKKELANTKVTVKNQDQVNKKIEEVSKLDKQIKQVEQERFDRIEQDFVNSKDEASAEVEAEKRLNDLLSNTGVWNNVKSFAKEVYNTALTGLAGSNPINAGLVNFAADTDPLADEKNTIKKQALKDKVKLSDKEISEKAKQLYKDKQIQNIEDDRISSFLENLPEDDKLALKQDRLNTAVHLQEENLNNEKVINAYTVFGNKKIEEYKAIENQLKALKEKGIAFPEDLYNKYISLSSDIKNISENIQKRQDSLIKNKEDLGTAQQEFDLLKRQYGDVENFVIKTGIAGRELLTGIASGLNYLSSMSSPIGQMTGMQIQGKLIDINKGLAEERENLRKNVESIESVDGLINYASDVVSNQIPNLVATSTGAGGLALMGVSGAGQKYSEMTQEVLDGKATYKPYQMALAPLFYGAAEVVSEIPTLSILRKGSRVLDAVVKNEADLLTKTAVQKGKEFAKDFLGDQLKEGSGEQFTNFAQNVNDKFLLGKKDVGLLDNTGTVFKDTFTLTSMLKVTPHLFGLAVKPFQSKTDLGLLDENARKILQFSKSLNTLNLTEDERKVIQGQIDRATAENSKIIANTIDKISNMPNFEYLKVIELNKKAAELKNEAKITNDGNLPNKEIILKDLENQYRDLQTERSSIINTQYSPYAQLESLPADELVDLKNEAQRKLMSELNPEGDKNITITDDQISKEALSIYKEKNKSAVTEEVTVEAPAIEVTQENTPEAAITDTTPKTYVEELAKTKESDPETYWSVSEVSPEDAAKGTIIDTPDGSALVKPDGDIAGLFKKPTSDAKGVAQDLLNKAVAAGGIKLDNFDGYLTNQYEKAGFRVVSRTPFNEQYAPEGWNKEKHGTPDVVAMVYDPNNELDIEEKVFENPETGYDDAIAYRDSFVGQAKALTTEVNNTQELIDESEKSNDLPSLVEKAKTALSGILPNVDVVLYNTEEEYKKAVGESLSSGTFVDDTIHINPKRANGRTVAHEVFHAVLLSMVKTDPEAQRITAKMITAIEKVLPPDMKAKLQQFVEDGYNGQDEVWDEEKLAELIGFLADGYPSLSKPAQSLIKQWLDQIAKFFGLKEFTDAEVVDLMNTLSGKVSKGEVLTEEDIKILGPAKINVTTESVRKSKFIDSLVFNRFPTNKNTKVIENFDIKSINGQVAASTLSDKLTAGELKKYKTVDGKKVLESVYTFFGGIGYPEVTGRIWAASTMSGVQKIINDMVVSSDGYRYLIPAVMSNVSHMSNKNMTSITMEVFKEAINNKELNRTDFKNLVSKAFNNKDTIKFKDDAIKSISGNISADKMVDNLRDYVLSSNMTFESRKKLLESMVGNPVSGNPKFSTVGTFLSLATSLSDPIAKDAQLYQVPVIIRTKGNLTPVQSKKGDEFYHESYGYHIESDQEVEVLHLDGTYNLTDIIPEFTNEVGRTVSTEQEIKEKSAKGWDIKRILTNLGRTHGLSRYSAKIDYKDKTSRKQVSSEFNKELNDKEINLLRRSLRMKFKDSFVVEVLDDYVNSIKEDTYANNEATQYLLDNGVTLNRLANLMVEEGNFETKSRALGYFNTVGGLGESVLSRKQVSTPIARLKKEGKTDKQISKYLQSKGFTIEQATEAILNYNKQKMNTLQKQEGVFTRDGRNKVITSLDSFKRMFLSAKAFLPKNAFIAKENIEAGIKAQSKIASYLVNDLDVAIKNYDGDKDKVISDFDKFVRGEEVELPDNFIEIGNAMRDHIDKLSYELINSGIVDEYQAENIRKNIGTYLTRSYEVFDKDNWAEKVDQEVLQAAKNFLKKQLLSEATKEAKKKGLDVKSVLENKVDLAINDLIDREGAQSFVSSGKTGSKDVSILKQKTDIPFEIRALMGEYTDPAQNYSRTIFKIASLINNAKFLNTIRDNGIGVYLFEKNDINRPKEFDTLIAAEGSETMNPLNGLYTTKEIAGSLKESAGILNSIEVALPFEVSSTVKSTYEYYMKLLSTVKWLKTVGSVGTHFKNVSGNITFMLANGYFKPDEYRKSAQVIHNDFFNRTNNELREKMQEYVDAGIVDQSAVLGELRSMFKDADFDKSFERRMNSEELNPSKKFVDKVKRLGKKGVSLAENAYQAEDDYFKVISYETEKSRYAKAMYGKEYSKLTGSQQDDVKKYVTEITKNVLPNYGRVPGAVKLVKAFPVVGTFISFQTEALRTAYNIVNLSITELKSSNPDIKKIGALRMAGIISSQAVKYAMMYLIGGAVLGDDEDEKKEKAKRFVAPWSKNSNILIKNEGDGKFSYIDFSASDPFGGIVKPINAMMAGEDLLDGFIEGVKEAVSPFTNPDILKSMFTEISENKDAYGNQLYNPSDTFEKKSEAILSRVYKTFEPGTISSARKIADSDGALNEMAGQFTGYKANDIDLEKQFSFKISDMKKKEVEVRNIYNRAARKFENKEVSKEELQKAYNQSNQESKKLYEELKKDYDAAIYFGTDAKALKKEMKRAKVSKEIIRSVLTGKFKDMEKKKSPLTDEELKKKNPKLYEMRMRMRKATN